LNKISTHLKSVLPFPSKGSLIKVYIYDIKIFYLQFATSQNYKIYPYNSRTSIFCNYLWLTYFINFSPNFFSSSYVWLGKVFTRFQLNLRRINLRKRHKNIMGIHTLLLNGCTMFWHLDDSALELKYALFLRKSNLLLFELKVPKHRGAEKSRILLNHPHDIKVFFRGSYL
jgi:hypothetical protein